MSSHREPDDEHTTRLELLCAELSGELGIEPPPCSVWNTRRIIAGAWLGRKTRLKVSRAAMERLDAMALRWVVAHELGHVADADGRRRLQVARRVFGLSLVAVLLATPLVPEPAGHVLLVAMVAYNLTAGIRLRRRIERAADRAANRCCAADPDAARRALTAMRQSSGMRSERLFRLTNAVAGYPPLDERIAAASR